VKGGTVHNNFNVQKTVGNSSKKKGFQSADPYMPLSFILKKLSFMGLSCSISYSRKGKKERYSFSGAKIAILNKQV